MIRITAGSPGLTYKVYEMNNTGITIQQPWERVNAIPGIPITIPRTMFLSLRQNRLMFTGYVPGYATYSSRLLSVPIPSNLPVFDPPPDWTPPPAVTRPIAYVIPTIAPIAPVSPPTAPIAPIPPPVTPTSPSVEPPVEPPAPAVAPVSQTYASHSL